MKRMSEVFDLPISGVRLERKIIEAHFCTEEDHAAHAINHVDALADALAVLIKLVDDKEDGDMFRNSAYKESVQVLAAYRGDK